jgi:RNA polymerase sigma-70 factor (sigma-E family)
MAENIDFDVFVAARSPAMLRTAYLLVRDRDLAEDLLQTALTKSWFAWGRIHGDPEPYVRRILVTTATSWWRRRWNGETPSADLPDRMPQPGEPFSARRQDLWTAIGHLPRRQRAVVVLRYYEDLTEVETARLLGCSVGTVKSQNAKALASLRLDSALTLDEGTRS